MAGNFNGKIAIVGDESILQNVERRMQSLALDVPIVQADPDFVIVAGDDATTFANLKRWKLPRERVVGIGTLPSTIRFRDLIAERLKLHTDDVRAYIAGASGGGEIPLWSSATVANIPLHEWAVQGHGKLSVMDRTAIFQDAKKDSSYEQIAAAVIWILTSIVRDHNRVLPVSSLVQNWHDIDDVCLSLPCILGARGVEPPLPIHLNANEEAGLKNAAEVQRNAR